VRYGANGSYFYKTVTGSIPCANTTWGDPAAGARKSCDISSTTTPPPTTPPPTTPPPTTPPIGTVLPTPTNVASGATVSLQCGTTYQGTLELNGKTNVTVKTVGTCGKAGISPGRAVTGWVKGAGNIYSAPISFAVVQVAVDSTLVPAAHWPNQPWATSTSGMPSSDLAGANHVFLDNQSVIRSQVLTGNSVSAGKPFYVEGKLWMLDSPGEWAVSNGRIHMWSPDGSNPEGKVWASANGNGVNADNSSGITIDGVRIFSATDGVSANSSTNLKVLNTDITNSARDGIWASGSKGLQVNLSNVSNSRRNGIDGWYSVNGAVITNSTVSNTGMSGMPSTTDAGIMFGDGGTNTIDNVRVTNSGYHGISVLHNRNTSVKNSVVDGACVRLHDCGGIYTGARDKLPLTLLIDNNTVTNVKGSENVGIYLDDHANGVTISRNKVSNTTRAMFLHNSFDTVISNNTLASSEVAHLQFSQDAGTIRNNKVTNNTFNSANGEFNYNTESGTNLKTFMSADYNTYTSNNPNVFHRYWDGRSAGVTQSYTGWKGWGGQDAHSTINGR
jgi:parallel beta-helix repeat protein